MSNSTKQFKRIRDWMHIPGQFLPGPRNSITDVPGVKCAHITLKNDNNVCTGLTLISPCEGDVFINPLPAAVAVGNGFGKMTGALQIEELGTLESVIGLTNTLSIAAVMQGLVKHHTPTMPKGSTINIVVGETNDGRLNDIHGTHVKPLHVAEAIGKLSEDVAEGGVGAGAGTVCFGFKGGIGTSSRVIPAAKTGEGQDFTIGAIVQSNYRGYLTVYGQRIQKAPEPLEKESGSCMIVLLTDAPVSSRQLRRLAKRGIVGLTNTGSVMYHGSGDFCIAASNYQKNRQIRVRKGQSYYYLSDSQLDLFFEGCADAVQEALYNSLTMAAGASYNGKNFPGLDLAEYADILQLKIK